MELEVSLQNATGVHQYQIPIYRFRIPAVLRSVLILSSHVGLDLAISQLPLDSVTPPDYSHCSNAS